MRLVRGANGDFFVTVSVRTQRQNPLPCKAQTITHMPFNRRAWLQTVGAGFAALACDHLLADESNSTHVSGSMEGLHHPAKVKRVLQLFMNGGVSQMDTFDYKPELQRRHGETVDFGIKAAVTSVPGALMKSPFTFKQYGQCGRWVSDMLPHMAEHVDELAFLMAMQSKTNVHGPASYLQNTGFVAPGFPCLGAWITYALGRSTDELPSFVVLPDHRGLPYNNTGNFSAGFLPASNAGTIIKPNQRTPISNLLPPADAPQITNSSEADGLGLLLRLNESHHRDHPDDTRLQARPESFELAARMQLSAPEALDISRETATTPAAYGLNEEVTAPFGTSCLVARRLRERGVRFVQLWSGMGGPKNNWDNHTDIISELPYIARTVDKPIGGLLTDLRQRGLLEDTLVIWTTEFGRMPFTQGATGRDHNGGTFVSWMCGAGIRGGVTVGESDPFGYTAVNDVRYGYDLHATALHLMGIDHTRLTYRHNGLDRRLTDVHGHVIHEVLS